MPEKHSAYFELIEALQSPDCAICRRVKDKVNSYFKNLLDENINDVQFRRKLREEGGFCSPHAYQFLHLNDALATAIVQRDLLQSRVERFQEKRAGGTGQAVCPVCAFALEIEKRCYGLIIDYLSDRELINVLMKSKGFCFPHFEGLAQCSAQLPGWLTDFQIERCRDLIQALDRFIESQNVASGEKPLRLSKADEESWERAIAMFYGYEGKP